jgi:hypothetical protein
MTINFPLLRFGLMVGIGGGAPTPPNYNDIRLGDVVVSSATGEFEGVVQYDHSKTVQEGVFTRTGCLNRPPDVLRQAVTSLRATYRLNRSRFTEYLSPKVLEFDTFASPSVAKGSQDIPSDLIMTIVKDLVLPLANPATLLGGSNDPLARPIVS